MTDSLQDYGQLKIGYFFIQLALLNNYSIVY